MEADMYGNYALCGKIRRSMKKIVINRCFGGFGLSYAGVMEYAKRKGIKLYAYVDAGSGGNENYSRYIKFDPKRHKDAWSIHYSTSKLKNGEFDNEFYFSERLLERDDPHLIATVEAIKEKANGSCAKLKIVEIPDDVEWEIDEYDGMEQVQEKCRKWS